VNPCTLPVRFLFADYSTAVNTEWKEKIKIHTPVIAEIYRNIQLKLTNKQQ